METKTDVKVNNPNTKINLIRTEFDAKLQEIKELTPKDRDELASGIARQKGLTEKETGWPLVEY